MVGCDRRFSLQSEIAKKLIDDGFIGKLTMTRSTMHELIFPYQENIASTEYRLKPEQSGSGTLFDQGSHKVDLLRWLTGKEVKRVIGSARRMLMPAGCPDDVAWVLMEFEDRTMACVSTNRFSPTVSEVTELYGSEGTIYLCADAINPFQSVPLAVYTGKEFEWDDLPDLIKKYRYPQSFFFEDWIAHPVAKRWVPVIPPRESSYARMLAHFVECLISDREPSVSGEDGAHVMEIMCGVFKSMETNAWVDLPLKEEIFPPGYPERSASARKF
jgi:predicted dehydrogenase